MVCNACCAASIFHARSLCRAFRAVHVEFMNNGFPKSIQFGWRKEKWTMATYNFHWHCFAALIIQLECANARLQQQPYLLLFICYSIFRTVCFFIFRFWISSAHLCMCYPLPYTFCTKCRTFARLILFFFHLLKLNIYLLFFIQISKVRVGPAFLSISRECSFHSLWVCVFVISYSLAWQKETKLSFQRIVSLTHPFLFAV